MAWRNSQITLIYTLPVARGVGTDPVEKRHTVPCSVESIGQKEHYLAKAAGVMVEAKVRLPYAQDYNGETQAFFEGEYYNIERAYNPATNDVELVLYPSDRVARGEYDDDDDDDETEPATSV